MIDNQIHTGNRNWVTGINPRRLYKIVFAYPKLSILGYFSYFIYILLKIKEIRVTGIGNWELLQLRQTAPSYAL